MNQQDKHLQEYAAMSLADQLRHVTRLELECSLSVVALRFSRQESARLQEKHDAMLYALDLISTGAVQPERAASFAQQVQDGVMADTLGEVIREPDRMPLATHITVPYHAQCLQWDGSNTEAIFALVKQAGGTAEHWHASLLLRYQGRIDSLYPGWWLRLGENGALKVFKPELFALKYRVLS